MTPGPGGPATDPIVASGEFVPQTDTTRDTISGLKSQHVIYNQQSQQLQTKINNAWVEIQIPDGIVKRLMRQMFQETAGLQLNILEKLVRE